MDELINERTSCCMPLSDRTRCVRAHFQKSSRMTLCSAQFCHLNQPLLSHLTSFVNSYQPLLSTSPLLSTFVNSELTSCVNNINDLCRYYGGPSGGSTTGPLGPGPQAPELQGPPNSQQTKCIGHTGCKRSPGLNKH